MRLSVETLKRLASRRTILLVAAILLLLCVRFTPLADWTGDPKTLKAFVLEHAHGSMPLFFALSVGLQMIGCSRLLLGGLAGLVFGFWWGLALVQASTLASAYVVYLLARGQETDIPEKVRKVLSSCGLRQGAGGISTVFLVRQVPLPGILISIGLGRLRTPQLGFLIGSFLGYLPAAIPATAIGSGFSSHSHLTIILSLAGAGVAVLVAAWTIRAARRGAEPAQSDATVWK